MTNAYSVGFTNNALNGLRKVDKSTVKRILAKILWLARSIPDVHHDALSAEWAGYYRVRVGNYRVIYQLVHDEKLIIIVLVGHRRDIYD